MAATKDLIEEPVTASTEKAPPIKGLLKVIFFRELLDQFVSLRFYCSFALVVFLMCLCGFVYSVKYRTAVGEYRASLTRYERQLAGKSVNGLVAVRHPALRPPWNLSFLVEGGQAATPGVTHLQLSPQPGQPLHASASELKTLQSPNYRLRPLESLDWTFIVRFLLSLVAFILAYDAVCGEKQNGILRLIMSYSVSRSQLLAAKFLAGWMGVVVPFGIGVLLSLAILIQYGKIELSAADMGKIGIFCLFAFLAVALFVMLSLLVSASTQKGTTSLVILLLVWVAFVVAHPAASGMLAHKLKPIPKVEEISAQIQAIFQETTQEYKNHGWSIFRGRELGRVDNYATERISAEGLNKCFVRQEAVRQRYQTQKLAQVEWARNFSSISPTSMFQFGSEDLIGSGLSRDRRFMDQVSTFRGILGNYFKSLDGMDNNSPHIHFIAGYMSNQKIDPSAVPRFRFRELSVAEGIRKAAWHILILGLEIGIAAAAAYLAFLRYDVR